MTQEDRETLLRQHAAGQVTWHALQELGFNDYIEVLGGLAELGLRPRHAPIHGPNVAARERGLAMLRRAISALP